MSRAVVVVVGVIFGALAGLAVTLGALFMRVRSLERSGREL